MVSGTEEEHRLTGLEGSTTYTVTITSQLGDLESSPATATFTTTATIATTDTFSGSGQHTATPGPPPETAGHRGPGGPQPHTGPTVPPAQHRTHCPSSPRCPCVQASAATRTGRESCRSARSPLARPCCPGNPSPRPRTATDSPTRTTIKKLR